jgi:Ca-activated chloride channel family protein
MADEDFRDDEKDAGDVGPGAQFTVAYEVALVDSGQPIATSDLKYGDEASGDKASDEWLTATIRYQPADGSDTSEQVVTVGKGDLVKDPGEDWRFQAAVIELGMLLRDSDYAGTASLDEIEGLVGTRRLADEREGFLDLADLALG